MFKLSAGFDLNGADSGNEKATWLQQSKRILTEISVK